MCPKYSNEFLKNSHFSLFTRSPHFSSLFSTASRLDKWCASSLPVIRMSSRKQWTDGNPCSTCSMARWNIDGADVMPKGTIGVAHSLNRTGEMIPCLSRWLISSSTLGLMAYGTTRAWKNFG
ncbi:hypothetical protein XENTR_v10014928 [Xenopus tropicalis]|nr:hypothetical protein XENTR_v10016237 [Xenopus tropicalis]KAE8604998.1 hypothetical protein XENTR_v10014928 [Xenopus tropicalis]